MSTDFEVTDEQQLEDIEELTVSMDEAACGDEVFETHEELQAALDRWQQASSELLTAWEGAIDDGLDPLKGISEYPEFMPSFDEFVIEISGMRVVDEQPEPE